MKKTVYALFLLVICLFCFPVESVYAQNSDPLQKNAFRIVRKGYADGQISLSYIFPINSDGLEKKGFSKEEINVYKFYLTTYVNALAKTNAEKAGEGVTVENSSFYTDVDGIGFSILFKDLDAQKKFFGVTESSGSGGQEKSGLFVTKTKINTTFPVSSSKSAGDLKMICLMAVSAWSTNNSLSKEKRELAAANYQDSVFIYDFALQEKGLKSQVMYEDENFYHNVFIKTAQELDTDNKITFWVTNINAPVWYISAIVVVVLGMGMAWLIVCVRRKRKK